MRLLCTDAQQQWPATAIARTRPSESASKAWTIIYVLHAACLCGRVCSAVDLLLALHIARCIQLWNSPCSRPCIRNSADQVYHSDVRIVAIVRPVQLWCTRHAARDGFVNECSARLQLLANTNAQKPLMSSGQCVPGFEMDAQHLKFLSCVAI